MEVALPKRPFPPAITASHLPQQQLSLSSFSRLSPMGGCFRLGLPEQLVASGTAPGGKASIFLCASPGHPPSFAVTPSRLTFPRTARLRLGSAAPPCAVCGGCACVCARARVCVCQMWCRLLLVTLVWWGARTGRDMAGGQRLARTPSLHVRHRSARVSGHRKGFGILPEPLPVLPGLAAAPWTSHPIAPAQSRGGAAPPSPAPWAGGSFPAQDKLPIKLGFFSPL